MSPPVNQKLTGNIRRGTDVVRDMLPWLLILAVALGAIPATLK